MFTGEYVMWMDSDDILYPDHVSKKVQFLEQNPQCAFVLVQGERVSSDNPDVRLGVMKREKPTGPDMFFEDLLNEKNVVFCPATMMVRKTALETAIPQKEIYASREGQNWQLMLPLAYLYQGGYLEEVLYKYVVHSDSHSNQRRNYDQWIRRYNGFEALQTTTIERIVQMSVEEKEHWINAVRIRCALKRLGSAYRFFKFDQINKERKILRSLNYTLTGEDGFVFYWTSNVVKVAKRKLGAR